MNDVNRIYADALTISKLTEEKIFLQEQLEIANSKITALYDIIERHENELRILREKNK